MVCEIICLCFYRYVVVSGGFGKFHMHKNSCALAHMYSILMFGSHTIIIIIVLFDAPWLIFYYDYCIVLSSTIRYAKWINSHLQNYSFIWPLIGSLKYSYFRFENLGLIVQFNLVSYYFCIIYWRHVSSVYYTLFGNKITDEGSIQEKRVWSIQLILSALKLCFYCSRGLKHRNNCFIWLCIAPYIVFNSHEGSVAEMRKWSNLLIKSYLKWCIHLSISLFYICAMLYILLFMHFKCSLTCTTIHSKRIRKRSDSVLWQKPLHWQKNPKSNVTTQKRHQNFDYTTIASRLRTVRLG